MAAKVAPLAHRALLSVTGADAGSFLDRLVTADVDKLAPGLAQPSALLSPQGKVLSDFLISRRTDGFLIDLPAAAAGDLLKRLTLYRLRADVAVAADPRSVSAIWDGPPPEGAGEAVLDGRAADFGLRLYAATAPAATATAGDHDARRIAFGLAESGRDAAFGEVFPHDLALDRMGGVAFDKGCYVGQEVVSRMQHRGTARRRPVIVGAGRPLPPTGTELTAAGRPIGTLGTVCGRDGLAIVRLDRARAAMDGGREILAGDVPVALTLPPQAGYDWPAGGEAAD